MHFINKAIFSALLALSALGLTVSLPAFADGASDAAVYCTGCHNGLTVTNSTGVVVLVVGGGVRSCPQRTQTEWVRSIERMNSKGCGVPADLIAGIASYLTALIPPPAPTTTSTSISTTSSTSTSSSSSTLSETTTTIPSLICYSPTADGLSYTSEISYIGYCSSGWAYSPPPPCPDGTLSIIDNHSWLCTPATSSTTSTTITTVATTTTTTGASCAALECNARDAAAFYCTGCHDGLTVIDATGVVVGVVRGGAKTCPQRTYTEWVSTIERMNGKGCGVPPSSVSNIANYLAGLGGVIATSTTTSSSTTSTSSSTTTVATTTTTTLCNTNVNGTTQYPYSGKGSCHGHADDGSTSGHVVRDQKWCRKHMTHYNSVGNHTHAYPHPVCM